MCLTTITNIRQLPWMKSMEKRPNFGCSMSKCTFFMLTSQEVYVLELSNYFFALNHTNYARWTVQYYNNLILVPETRPETRSEFKRGCFFNKKNY